MTTINADKRTSHAMPHGRGYGEGECAVWRTRWAVVSPHNLVYRPHQLIFIACYIIFLTCDINGLFTSLQVFLYLRSCSLAKRRL